ncbi:CpaF family protein [Marinobacter sp.]|uniref:CpaF family protein n=1 Tax=Marinobacter sp. TaxID=50741 RepID=UPI003B527749
MHQSTVMTDDLVIRLRQHLHQRLIASVESEPLVIGNPERLKKRLWHLLESIKTATGLRLSSEQGDVICTEVANEVIGFGPLAKLMADPDVTDILVNGADAIWVDRSGQLELTDVQFDDEAHVRRFVDRYVGAEGKHLDSTTPTVDTRLPDGSRMNIVIPPLSRTGTIVSIRRFRPSHSSVDDLIQSGMLSREMADLLILAVEARVNIVFAGGAGAGKTTLLNAVSEFIPDNERIITIEESSELALRHQHVITLEGRQGNSEGRGKVDLRLLVRNALRMRADRIIIGEVRGDEVFDMLQAMNVGHDGSLTTIHANNPYQVLRRMETLAMLADGQIARETVRNLIESAVQIVVQIARTADGHRHVTSICEVGAGETGYLLTELFCTGRDIESCQSDTGRRQFVFEAGSVRPGFFEGIWEKGLEVPASLNTLWPVRESESC